MKTLIIGTAMVASLGLAAAQVRAGDQVVGAAVGAGVGAVVGHSISGRDGAVVGGALGAVTGAAIAAHHRHHYHHGPYVRTAVAVGQPVYYGPPPAVVYQPRPVYVAPRGYYHRPYYPPGHHYGWHQPPHRHHYHHWRGYERDWRGYDRW